MRKAIAALSLSLLALTGCLATPPDNPTVGAPDRTDRTFGTFTIEKVEQIAALLPDQIRSRGKLVVGSTFSTVPSAFRTTGGASPIGYEVNLLSAVGKVLDIKIEFIDIPPDQVLGGIGQTHDIALGSLPITAENLNHTAMLRHITVGGSFGVQSRNPKQIDVDHLCGWRIGVQDGTPEHAAVERLSDTCRSKGKSTPQVTTYQSLHSLVAGLTGEDVDVIHADSASFQYAIDFSVGAVVQIGAVRHSVPHGIAVGNDTELTHALQRATQHLMDDGTWRSISHSWGVRPSIVTKAELVTAG